MIGEVTLVLAPDLTILLLQTDPVLLTTELVAQQEVVIEEVMLLDQVLTTPQAKSLLLPLNIALQLKPVKALIDSLQDPALMTAMVLEDMICLHHLTQWPQKLAMVVISKASQVQVPMTRHLESQTIIVLTIESEVLKETVYTKIMLLQDLELMLLVLKAHTTRNPDLNMLLEMKQEAVLTVCPKPFLDLVNIVSEENLIVQEKVPV
jgi:hypothetical protein